MIKDNVNWYESNLVKLINDELNTLLNPYNFEKLKGVTDYDYYVLERASAVLEKLAFMNNNHY